MTDETTNRLVIVRREALEGVAQPPDGSVERVLQFLDTFASVATNKPEHGRAGAEARRPRRIRQQSVHRGTFDHQATSETAFAVCAGSDC